MERESKKYEYYFIDTKMLRVFTVNWAKLLFIGMLTLKNSSKKCTRIKVTEKHVAILTQPG